MTDETLRPVANDAAYFADAPLDARTPAGAGRFATVDDAPVLELALGVTFRPILGESTLLSFVEFLPDSIAPMHAHVEEQLVIILDGELHFTLGEETRTLRRGQLALIPPWVVHGARAGSAGCREVDVFNPPRAAMLDLIKSADSSDSRGQ